MPSFSHLYEERAIRGQGADDALQFPKGTDFDKYAPEEGIEIVPTDDARMLVAYLMVVGAIFVVVNTVVDIIYGLVNPTIRIAGR